MDSRRNAISRASWHQRCRSTRAILRFAVVGAAILLIWLVFDYRVHLHWWIGSLWSNSSSTMPIPTIAMPDVEIPADWGRYRFGVLELALPRELAKTVTRKTTKSGQTMVVLKDQSRTLIVMPEQRVDRFARKTFLQEDLAVPPEGRSLSLTRLRVACYSVGSDDFRWSMTPDEVRWHSWCVATSGVMRMGAGERAVYLLRKDSEGILNLRPERGIAWFDWESGDGRFEGSLTFTDRSGKIDATWIRAVCRSLSFSAGGGRE